MTDTIAKENVLIVDDNPTNLILLEHNIRDLDLNIVKASSGPEALVKVKEYDFALILMDVQMPAMTGFEAVAAIRADEATKYVPVIFITALGKQNSMEFKGYESGAVDYLTKPVEVDILKSKVRIFIELHRQKKIIERQKIELVNKVEELQKALKEIKTLQGIIPICVHCKKIRDDQGFWESVEQYISDRSDVGFSHGICPSCLREHFPEFAEDILDKKNDDQ